MGKQFVLLSIVLLLGATLQAAEKGALKDPMRPFSYRSPAAVPSELKAEEPLEWRLGAVLTSATRSIAVINGKALQVGDLLNGYQVKTIEPKSVLLQKNKKKLVLRRSGTGLKKAVPTLGAEEGSQP